MTQHSSPWPLEDAVTSPDDAPAAGLDAEESDHVVIDYEAVRRFPWVGLGASGEQDLSTRYREISVMTRQNDEIMETTNAQPGGGAIPHPPTR
jgi:hypothetical protein